MCVCLHAFVYMCLCDSWILEYCEEYVLSLIFPDVVPLPLLLVIHLFQVPFAKQLTHTKTYWFKQPLFYYFS